VTKQNFRAAVPVIYRSLSITIVDQRVAWMSPMALSNGHSVLIRSQVCRVCTLNLRSARSFVTSASYMQQSLPPESPNYVDYPKPPQPDFRDIPPVKGILPVPRNVFKHRGDVSKTSDEFFAKSTPEPTNLPAKSGQRTLWKQRMATMRRRNLREGISELSRRKSKTEKILSTKGLEKQHENRRLLLKPEVEDEHWTRASVDVALRNYLSGGAAPRGESPLSVEKRKKQHQKIQDMKSEDRQAALHSLYMHARSFITTEQELEKAINEAFDEKQGDQWYSQPFRNICLRTYLIC
jgi:hypothetical protein